MKILKNNISYIFLHAVTFFSELTEYTFPILLKDTLQFLNSLFDVETSY